jgi:hypothetical protein
VNVVRADTVTRRSANVNVSPICGLKDWVNRSGQGRSLANAVTTGYRIASHEVVKSRPVLTSLFDPEFTPACRTDFTVDQRAGVGLLE